MWLVTQDAALPLVDSQRVCSRSQPITSLEKWAAMVGEDGWIDHLSKHRNFSHRIPEASRLGERPMHSGKGVGKGDWGLLAALEPATPPPRGLQQTRGVPPSTTPRTLATITPPPDP